MRSRSGWRSLFLVLAGAVVVSACTNAQAAQPTSSAITIIRGSVFEFAQYVDPSTGYEIAVPKDATMVHSPDGLLVSFQYESESVFRGTYTLTVEIKPNSPAGSAQELLAQVTAGEKDLSPVKDIFVDEAKSRAVFRSFATEPGEHCARPRALALAVMHYDVGLVVHIFSDAEGRCDVESLPETLPVLGSIRFADTG